MKITITKTDPILMVDDSEADHLIAKRCYQKSMLQNPFQTFLTGKEFLSYMASVLKNEARLPCVVFLDLNMPEMDGFEVLKSLRQQPEFNDAPIIIILTNSDNPKDFERSMELGANGFQIKPLHMTDYITFFNSFCE